MRLLKKGPRSLSQGLEKGFSAFGEVLAPRKRGCSARFLNFALASEVDGGLNYEMNYREKVESHHGLVCVLVANELREHRSVERVK